MPVVEVQSPGGEIMRVHSEQGFNYKEEMVKGKMPAKDAKLQLQWIKEMDVAAEKAPEWRLDTEDPDTYVPTLTHRDFWFPYPGTHWLWEVVAMLSKEESTYDKNVKELSMLEFLTKEEVASLPSPRILNTHHTPPILPDGFIDRKCKIIHVMRNPKDVCVSLYHHMMAFRAQFGFTAQFAFSHLARMFISEGLLAIPCSYMWFIKQFEQFQKKNPDYPIINVFYEDMIKQPEMEIKKLAKFLNKDISDDLAADIAEKCRFDNLKKANDEHKDDPFKHKQMSPNGQSPHYRKGKIGDWKNHFTVAENELFDKWTEEQLKESDITFEYE